MRLHVGSVAVLAAMVATCVAVQTPQRLGGELATSEREAITSAFTLPASNLKLDYSRLDLCEVTLEKTEGTVSTLGSLRFSDKGSKFCILSDGQFSAETIDAKAAASRFPLTKLKPDMVPSTAVSVKFSSNSIDAEIVIVEGTKGFVSFAVIVKKSEFFLEVDYSVEDSKNLKDLRTDYFIVEKERLVGAGNCGKPGTSLYLMPMAANGKWGTPNPSGLSSKIYLTKSNGVMESSFKSPILVADGKSFKLRSDLASWFYVEDDVFLVFGLDGVFNVLEDFSRVYPVRYTRTSSSPEDMAYLKARLSKVDPSYEPVQGFFDTYIDLLNNYADPLLATWQGTLQVITVVDKNGVPALVVNVAKFSAKKLYKTNPLVMVSSRKRSDRDEDEYYKVPADATSESNIGVPGSYVAVSKKTGSLMSSASAPTSKPTPKPTTEPTPKPTMKPTPKPTATPKTKAPGAIYPTPCGSKKGYRFSADKNNKAVFMLAKIKGRMYWRKRWLQKFVFRRKSVKLINNYPGKWFTERSVAIDWPLWDGNQYAMGKLCTNSSPRMKYKANREAKLAGVKGFKARKVVVADFVVFAMYDGGKKKKFRAQVAVVRSSNSMLGVIVNFKKLKNDDGSSFKGTVRYGSKKISFDFAASNVGRSGRNVFFFDKRGLLLT